MKAVEASLLRFLQGAKQFVIPIFQRTYSWELKHCEQLWRDIMRVGRDKDSQGHFIGSVVYIQDGNIIVPTAPKLLVIDGQQRLTTISLLISALAIAIEGKDVDVGTTRKKLENYYLFNTEEEGELRQKLELTRADKEALIRITNGELPVDDAPRRIRENFQFFQERMKDSDLCTVFAGIGKLLIVSISLDREHDNPQLIFESLNSTGLGLAQADLIRNYVLMGLEPKRQTKLYEQHWSRMEQSFGSYYTKYFDGFMRHYLTMKTRNIPNINAVYAEFKTYVRTGPKEEAIEPIIADIHLFAEHYVRMALGKEPDTELHDAFLNLRSLRVDVAYPFLLEIYHDYATGKLSRENLLEFLRLVECYVFRRVVCGIPTNSLNKTFTSLARDLDKSNYLESLSATFLRLSGYRRYPSDKEFSQELMVKDVYHLRNKDYFLSKMENYDRKERVNIKEYTTEHILPQNPNLSKDWQTELGENWKDIQSKYLHTIGNLTLTGYNPELSDRPFCEKRDLEKEGFKYSPLRLNKDLATLEHWNEAEIVKRAEKLSTLAVKIWPTPNLSPEVLKKYAKKTVTGGKSKPYTLADHPFVTGNLGALFEEFKKEILALDSSITLNIKKRYISFVTDHIITLIWMRKTKLSVRFIIPFAKIIDPKGICKDITNRRRWGNVMFDLKSVDEIPYAMTLVRQSFEWKGSE